MNKELRDAQVALEANRREVTRLAEIVQKLADERRVALLERDEWKRRFDRLLESLRPLP